MPSMRLRWDMLLIKWKKKHLWQPGAVCPGWLVDVWMKACHLIKDGHIWQIAQGTPRNHQVSATRITVWWPGLSRQVEELVKACHTCQQNAHSHPEPLIPTVFLQRPWQNVGMDLMEFRKAPYLIVVDHYLPFIEMPKLDSTTSTSIITHLKSMFARHGVPETIISDSVQLLWVCCLRTGLWL